MASPISASHTSFQPLRHVTEFIMGLDDMERRNKQYMSYEILLLHALRNNISFIVHRFIESLLQGVKLELHCSANTFMLLVL